MPFKLPGQKMFVILGFYFISEKLVYKIGFVLSYIASTLFNNNVNVKDEIKPTAMNVGIAVPFSCAPGK